MRTTSLLALAVLTSPVLAQEPVPEGGPLLDRCCRTMTALASVAFSSAEETDDAFARIELTGTLPCLGCGRELFVYYHVSRRLGTHLGFASGANYRGTS